MKNLLLLFATLFVFFNVSAQIPNPSFENWDNNGLYDEPTGWFTYNRYFTETGVTLCEKTTQHTDGAYALKLISKYSSLQKSVWPGWALSSDDTAQVDIKWGFPCTHRPVYFNCDIIYDHRGQDVGMVYIKFTKWDTATKKRIVVAENFKQLTSSITKWTVCQIKISYKTTDIPDTCAIGLICSDETTAVDSTSLIVDNLRFDPVAINLPQLQSEIQVYPTVAKEKITVLSDAIDIDLSSIQIIDLQGKMVKQLSPINLKMGNELNIDLNGIQDGFYILKLTADNRQYMKKFAKISDR